MTAGPKCILFARPADAGNINAQAKNVQNVLRSWRSTEFRPTVFAFFEPDEGVATNPNVDVLRIAPDRLWRAKVFAAYMGRFDAVFCPGLHHLADWAALKLRRVLGRPLPVITTMEGLLGIEGDDSLDGAYSEVAGHPAYSQKISRAHWRRTGDLYLMASHIIAISPFLGRQASARYGEKVSVLPLGVDVPLFRRTRWDRRTRPRVVCAANVQAHKKPHIFLVLAKRFPQADFVWFGGGDLRASLVEAAARDAVSNLSFPGVLTPDALAREFRSSDIMVLPSYSEGVPKVTQEAAAAGLAQIVFGFYEAPSVVDQINGFVVWSEEEMAARLAALLADRNLVERMGRVGARMAEEWSWEVVGPQWEQRIIGALRHAGSSAN